MNNHQKNKLKIVFKSSPIFLENDKESIQAWNERSLESMLIFCKLFRNEEGVYGIGYVILFEDGWEYGSFHENLGKAKDFREACLKSIYEILLHAKEESARRLFLLSENKAFLGHLNESDIKSKKALRDLYDSFDEVIFSGIGNIDIENIDRLRDFAFSKAKSATEFRTRRKRFQVTLLASEKEESEGDLIDSLYQGYPIGYLIAWRNPNVRLKDGTLSEGKKVLIDGQQRVTALTAAILGQYVINKDYERVKIKISFHPLEERFEVQNPAIVKDNSWIKDIAPMISGEERVSKIVREYCKNNPQAKEEKIEDNLENLKQIVKKQIGLIELDSDLDIETVTEIFIRINSQGVVLSQADFAMSKIAANDTYGGATLRKCIDFFCHLAVAPEFYKHIVDVDKEFSKTAFFQKMSWLKDENDDIYDPAYNDLLRVAFTFEFERGRLSDLVSLLSGRNFETRTFEEEIAKESFATLERGVLSFINETNFKRFVMIIRSAGFISSDLIRSQNALNFAYAVYLKLKALNYNPADIEQYVRRWYVLSILTGRYSGSPESQFDFDIKSISKKGIKEYLTDVEKAELSDAYWEAALVQGMDTSVASSPFFNVFLAAQVKFNDKGFLSRDITVTDLVTNRGDIHHIFPKGYLKGKGLKRGQYNQIANYVLMQSEINIKVANKAPNIYFNELREQCNNGGLKYGGISNEADLLDNLQTHCIPENIFDLDVERYEEFLGERRQRMARKIKEYYFSL